MVIKAMRRARPVPRTGAIVVDGAQALVPVLARELSAGGNAAAVREGLPSNKLVQGTVAVLVWVGEPDEAALREAALAHVPIVAVTDAERVPYVLATDVVRVPPGEGFPLDAIAAALARRLGDGGPTFAAELPV